MKKTNLFLTLGFVAVATSLQAQVAFTDTYFQNFNTLPATGTATMTLEGWTSNDMTLAATDGSAPNDSAPLGSMSFGVTGSSERALGSQKSGTGAYNYFALQLLNESGAAITSVTISYYVETWRIGGSVVGSDALDYQKWDFAYSLNATAYNVGTYTEFDALDGYSTRAINRTASGTSFVNSVTQVNGNLSENRALVTATLTLDTPWAANSSLWLRWGDFNDTGYDTGLGIDDLSVTAVPEPYHYGLMMAGLLGLAVFRRRLALRKAATV